MVWLGAWLPFGRAPAALQRLLRVTLSADTARRLTETAGAALVGAEATAAAQLERRLPDAPPGPARQQLSVDGAMVALVGGEWAEVRTVAVGTVTTAATGEAQTTDLSYAARLTRDGTFERAAWGELFRRGTPRTTTVCAVNDGATWIQAFVDLVRPDAVRVLDYPHALEHLAAAAQASLGAGTAAVACWLTQQRQALRHGDPAEVLEAVCRLPVERAPDPAQAQAARDATLQYLAVRWNQIQYAEFAAQGYPIGSGCVESANKLVVEARLKGSGMHWASRHVSPLVALRAAVCTGSARWDAALQTAAQQRQAVRQQRRRQRACRPVAAAPPAPSQTPVSPPPARRAGGAARPKLVVNGRPTADHPWRRFSLKGSVDRHRAKP